MVRKTSPPASGSSAIRNCNNNYYDTQKRGKAGEKRGRRLVFVHILNIAQVYVHAWHSVVLYGVVCCAQLHVVMHGYGCILQGGVVAHLSTL